MDKAKLSKDNMFVEVRLISEKIQNVDERVRDHTDRIYKIEIKNVGFEQAQKIVFGFLGLLLVSFSAALIALVLKA